MQAFPKGARVCFLGDSITHNNDYVSRITAYYHENMPERQVSFFNCAVGGGGVDTLLAIYEDDIIVHKPTHAVITIGTNDSRIGELSGPRSRKRYETLLRYFEIYKKNLIELCDKLEKDGVQIILCTSTPYDEYQVDGGEKLFVGGCALMTAYAAYVRGFAAQRGYPLCDYHTYITEMMQSETLFEKDRVHPNEDGQYYMAKCFLAFQGMELGEKQPIPEYMQDWRDKIQQLRNIHMTEYLVVRDYSLSTEQRLEHVRKYVENGGDEQEWLRPLGMIIGAEYLKTKPIQQQLRDEVDAIMASWSKA